jgi:hypothetical protein
MHPGELPAQVVYTLGGTLLPAMPANIDYPDIVHADVPLKYAGKRNRVNGLTGRADAMCRMVARGATASSAFRLAYNDQKTSPVEITKRLRRVVNHPLWSMAVARYREQLENIRAQTRLEMRDFVTGRLVIEAQTAAESASRITALKLLGQSQGMFVNITRSEKVLDGKSIDKLKGELNQRLNDALKRLFPVQFRINGTATHSHSSPVEDDTALPASHPMGTPLDGTGGPVDAMDTIPLKPSPPISTGSSRADRTVVSATASATPPQEPLDWGHLFP